MKRYGRHITVICLLTGGWWITGCMVCAETARVDGTVDAVRTDVAQVDAVRTDAMATVGAAGAGTGVFGTGAGTGLPTYLQYLDSLSLDYYGDLYHDPSVAADLSALTSDLRRIFAKPARLDSLEAVWETTLAILARMPDGTPDLETTADYIAAQIAKVRPALGGQARLDVWHLWYERGMMPETAYRRVLRTMLEAADAPGLRAIDALGLRAATCLALAESYRTARPDSAHWYATQGWRQLRESDTRPTDSALFCLIRQIEAPFFSVSGLNVYAPDRPMLWSVCAKNLKRLPYEIFHVPAAERMNLLGGMLPLDRYVDGKKALSQGAWSLEDFPQDYREHRAEMSLPPLKAGVYVLAVNRKVFVSFQVSDIAFADWGTIGFSLNRTTGEALPDAMLDIFTAEYDYTTHLNRYTRLGKTRHADADGLTDLSVPGNGTGLEPEAAAATGAETEQDRLSRFFLFRHGTDSLIRTHVWPPSTWRGTAGGAGAPAAEDTPDTLAGVHFFLDLPVYKAGDSVRFKGVLWARRAGTGAPFPVAGKTLVLSLDAPDPLGGRGRSVVRRLQADEDLPDRLYTATDSLGGFTGGFRLPATAAAGLWRLRASLVEPSLDGRRRHRVKDSVAADTAGSAAGLSSTETGTGIGMETTGRLLLSEGRLQYFRVEAYRPPLFEIRLENRDSAVWGRAVALDGQALSGATVRFDVRLERDVFRPQTAASQEAVWQAAAQTDADGCFRLPTASFSHLEAETEAAHFGGYRLTCTVIDLNGEMQTAALWLPLRRQAWQADLQIPARRGETGIGLGLDTTTGAAVDTFRLWVRNAAWERRQADYRLSIERLTDTLPDRAFDRRFPEPDRFPWTVDTFLRAFPDEPYYTQTMRRAAEQRQTVFSLCGRDTVFTAALPDGHYAYKILIAHPWISGRTDSCDGTFSLGRQPLVPTLYARLDTGRVALQWVVPDRPAFADPAWQTAHVFYSIESRNGHTRQGRRIVHAADTLDLSAFPLQEDLSILLACSCGGRLFQQSLYRAGLSDETPLTLAIEPLPDTTRTRASETLHLRVRRNGKAIAVPLTLALYDDALHAFAPENWFTYTPPRLVPPASVTPFDRHFYGYDPLWFSQEQAYTSPAAYAYAGRRGGFVRPYAAAARSLTAASNTLIAKAAGADLSTEIGRGGTETANAQTANDQTANGETGRNHALRGEQPASVYFFPTLWSDADGRLSLPFDLPAAPGRYRWVIAAYDRDLQAAYETRTIQSVQDYRLSWRLPQFLHAGDSVRFSAKAVRLDASKPQTIALRWEIAGQTFESTEPWAAGEREKPLTAPVLYSPQNSGLLTVRLYLSTRTAKVGDALEARIPVLSDSLHLKVHIPFALRPGEQIELNLPKTLCDALRRSPAVDTVFRWAPDPARRIGLLCGEMALDTANDAWNALLHYLKDNLLQDTDYPATRHRRATGAAATEAAFKRLCRFLTPDGGFCWLPGQPTDPIVSLAIAEALAADIRPDKPELQTLLRQSLLPYLEHTYRETTAADRPGEKPADSLPSPMRLRYLYTASLVYGPSADRYTADFRRDLDAFAGNLGRYQIRTGIYGLYALQRYGDTALSGQVWRHYRHAARYDEASGLSWKSDAMGVNQGERLKTASLVYRLLRIRNHLADAAAVYRWMGRQNRTVDLLSPMAAVRPIDVLTLAYNERLFPLPPLPQTTPTWQLKGRKLLVDWRTAAPTAVAKPDAADSIAALFSVYGALTFGYTQALSAVAASPASDLGIELLTSETLRQGESPVLRLRITSKHPASYVRVRFGRPGGSEYGSTRAGFTYKNGLAFYEDIRETYTDLLIPYLPVGRYLLSYPLNAQTQGRFTLPPARIETLLDAADSFSAHSHAPSVQIAE